MAQKRSAHSCASSSFIPGINDARDALHRPIRDSCRGLLVPTSITSLKRKHETAFVPKGLGGDCRIVEAFVRLLH